MLKYKRNILLRSTLIGLTAVLFLMIVSIFLSLFRQYKSFTSNIEDIYSNLNSDKSDYSALLSKHNEAENYFRLFAIDFDTSYFNAYKQTIYQTKTKIDSLSNLSPFNKIESQDMNELDRDKINTEFIRLRIKLDELLNYSVEIPKIAFQTMIPPSTAAAAVPSKDFTELVEEDTIAEYIVIPKKKLLNRIFDAKNDTVKYERKSKIFREHKDLKNKVQHHIENTNRIQDHKFENLKSAYTALRYKEREMVLKNFEILNDLNTILNVLQENNQLMRNNLAKKSIDELIKKTNSIKVEMTLSISFMFGLLIIIVLYQFHITSFEKKLIEEKSYARKLAQDKTDALSILSHEIRTPLNSLIGIVDILRKKINIFSSEDRLLIDTAYSGINNTAKTINDILNISKIDEHSNRQQNEEFNLWNTIETTVAIHKHDALLKKLTLKNENHIPPATRVYADELKIKQILINIISNAIKYSNKGTITCTSSISKNAILTLQISDEGIGIPAQMQKFIFRRFYTVSTISHVNSGVGLGLYITKKLIDGLQGSLEFKSELGVGTTFTILIPLKILAHNQASSHAQDLGNVLPTDLSILIVDDNPLNLLYMKQFFTKQDNCYIANNGNEALQLVEEHRVDVIITDLNMPGLSGIDLLEKIKNNSQTEHIRVICTSSTPEQIIERQEKMDLKFDEIIYKPFVEENLVKTILKTLQ